MRRIILLSLAALALTAAGCGDDDTGGSAATGTGAATAPAETTPTETAPSDASADLATKPVVEVPSDPPPNRLVTRDLVEGEGAKARPGDLVTVDYVGVLYDDGEQFDASWDRGEPFSFQLGAGQVIPGWDRGVAGMRVGGRRELIIPARLAYGAQGAPPAIPPNATLVFVVDLKDVA